MDPGFTSSTTPSCSNIIVPSATAMISECLITCSSTFGVPAGTIDTCTPTASPVASVPLGMVQRSAPFAALVNAGANTLDAASSPVPVPTAACASAITPSAANIAAATPKSRRLISLMPAIITP